MRKLLLALVLLLVVAGLGVAGWYVGTHNAVSLKTNQGIKGRYSFESQLAGYSTEASQDLGELEAFLGSFGFWNEGAIRDPGSRQPVTVTKMTVVVVDEVQLGDHMVDPLGNTMTSVSYAVDQDLVTIKVQVNVGAIKAAGLDPDSLLSGSVLRTAYLMTKPTPTDYKQAVDAAYEEIRKYYTQPFVKLVSNQGFGLVKQVYAQSDCERWQCGTPVMDYRCSNNNSVSCDPSEPGDCPGGSCQQNGVSCNAAYWEGDNTSCNNPGGNCPGSQCVVDNSYVCTCGGGPSPTPGGGGSGGGCADDTSIPGLQCGGGCSDGSKTCRESDGVCGCYPTTTRKLYVSYLLDANGNGVADDPELPNLIQGTSTASCGGYTTVNGFTTQVLETSEVLNHHTECDGGPKSRFDLDNGGWNTARVTAQPAGYTVIGAVNGCGAGSWYDAANLEFNCYAGGTGQGVQFLVRRVPPTCTLGYGSTTVNVGSNFNFSVNATQATSREAYSSNIDNTGGNTWTSIPLSSNNGVFTCPDAGNYYIVCNASNASRTCSGNPWCEWVPDANPPGADPLTCGPGGWNLTDCTDPPVNAIGGASGTNDVVQVTCVAPVCTCSVSLAPATWNPSTGQTTTFTATTTANNCTIPTVNFSSNNPGVVSLNPLSDSSSPYTSVGTAVAVGSATVTASATSSTGVACTSDTTLVTVSAPARLSVIASPFCDDPAATPSGRMSLG